MCPYGWCYLVFFKWTSTNAKIEPLKTDLATVKTDVHRLKLVIDTKLNIMNINLLAGIKATGQGFVGDEGKRQDNKRDGHKDGQLKVGDERVEGNRYPSVKPGRIPQTRLR